MQQRDFDSFRELMQGVFALYGKDVSGPVIDIWWQAMKAYDFAAIREAMGRHAVDPDRGQFQPKPADVVRLMAGTTQDSALAAWSKVDQAVRTVGTYASVAFDDPIIHAVVADMGGWIAFGEKDDDAWPFVAKEFETRYRACKARGGSVNYSRVLRGIHDRDNGSNGYEHKEPLLIGNPEAAHAVYLAGTDKPRLTVSRLPVADAVKAIEQRYETTRRIESK